MENFKQAENSAERLSKIFSTRQILLSEELAKVFDQYEMDCIGILNMVKPNMVMNPKPLSEDKCKELWAEAKPILKKFLDTINEEFRKLIAVN
jgi:hypothetical protein